MPPITREPPCLASQENSPPASSLKAAWLLRTPPIRSKKKLLKINDIGVIDMKLIATNSIELGRGEHRLAPCGFRDDEIEISCKPSKFSRVAVKEETRLTAPNPPAPLQVVYLHQRDAGMIARYRAWTNWLAEGRTRAVESELIAMDGGDPAPALSRASVCEWQVLIYEPPGYPCPAPAEVQP